MNVDYKRIFICPKYDKCANNSCFMHSPHTRYSYYKRLRNVAFRQCIEKFNESFECDGQKLKLDETKFTHEV